MKRLLCLTVAALFLLPSFFSCAKKEDPLLLHKRTETGLFDTVCTFRAGGEKEEFDKTADALFEELRRLDLLLDCYEQKEGVSGLAAVNANAGVCPVKVDPLLLDLFLYIESLPPALLEKVHPVMGTLTVLWKDATTAGIPPSDEALLEAAKHIDYSCLQIDEQSGTLYLSDPQARLDVGAFAKGYAAKVCSALLGERGVKDYLLDLGGNLTAQGKDPQKNAPWLLGVNDPQNEGYPLYTFSSSSVCLSTTGGDKRFFLYEGKRYHHVIDPATLYPAQKSDCLSVSVCGSDPALADALSTALFVLSPQEGKDLLENLRSKDPALGALYCKNDGSLLFTDGFPKKETATSSPMSIVPAIALLIVLLFLCIFFILYRKKGQVRSFARRHPLFFSKRNLLFLSVVLLLCLLLPTLFGKTEYESDAENAEAVIRYDGAVVKKIPLESDEHYRFSCKEGENLIVVEGGRVYVSSSDCAGGECVKSAPIDAGDCYGVIACLPHKLTVTVEQEEHP